MSFTLILPESHRFHETANTIAADTEGAAFIPEVWANRVLGRLHARCPMIGAVTRDFSEDLASEGDTVHIQKRGTLTTYDKTANTSVTLQNPTATQVDCKLDNHKEVSFLVEDVAEAQANVSILDGYITDGADAIIEDIEDNLTDLYSSAGTNVTWDTTDDESKLNSIIACRTAIVVDGEAPAMEPRYLIVRDSAVDFLGVTEFTSSDYVAGDRAIQSGEVGRIAGFTVKESGKIETSVSPSGTYRMALAQGAIALVTRRLPNPPANTGVRAATVSNDGVGVRVLYGYSMEYLGMQITCDILFGSCILRPEWLACLKESGL